jgi:spectinomycin phosphotransferase
MDTSADHQRPRWDGAAFADHHTAFTNGYRTVVHGPGGMELCPNTQRSHRRAQSDYDGVGSGVRKEERRSVYEPPVDLPEATLAAGLRSHYGLEVTATALLSLGQDTEARVYRVQTAADAYFAKVRRGVGNVPGLVVPRYLRDRGIAHVVAPLPTTRGALWADVAGHALTLYPFVAGSTGMARGMAPAQWRAYGALLRRIHATPISPELAPLLQRETFVPAGAALVRDLDASIEGRTLADPVAQELAPLWRERRDVIRRLVARAEALGRQVARRPPANVLCHADIHTNNVLLDADGALWIVDWDDTLLAPKERDLLFVVGGGLNRALVGPREEAAALRGYGPTPLDPRALTYYRYARAVSDLSEYGAQVLSRSDLSVPRRRAAIGRFLTLFQPGRLVESALASDDAAP